MKHRCIHNIYSIMIDYFVCGSYALGAEAKDFYFLTQYLHTTSYWRYDPKMRIHVWYQFLF
eukprot:UN14328